MLNMLLTYADGDKDNCLRAVLGASAAASSALNTKWDRLHVGGQPLIPQFQGLVGDTVWLWGALRRHPDRSWSKGLGGTFRPRSLFTRVNEHNVTKYFGAVTYTSAFMKCIHKVWCSINAKDNQNAFSHFLMEEFGIDATTAASFEGADFTNSMVGNLHLIGTASQNLMIDVAKIFEAAGKMNVFWEFLNQSCTDIGLKAKKASLRCTCAGLCVVCVHCACA